jgi:IS5 family transposase
MYCGHDIGVQLKNLSELLDSHPEILRLIKSDLVNPSLRPVGRNGLSVENVFRCLLLKQRFGLTYEKPAFHLSDSVGYRRLQDYR